ncbi:hypothetical protein [Streptomyces odonnellii]|uniref:hypothetical protein n=1 Tax=Streptomyces odonnellii TaxID=1417980 RepID=UPI000626D9B9|nr:hypothetical protein [Streptomyces odonnellii]
MKLATSVPKIASAPTGRLPYAVAVPSLPTAPEPSTDPLTDQLKEARAERDAALMRLEMLRADLDNTHPTADDQFGNVMSQLEKLFRLRATEARVAGTDPYAAMTEDLDVIATWLSIYRSNNLPARAPRP